MNKRFLITAPFISLFFIVFTSYTFFLEIPYNAKRVAEGFLLVGGVLAVVSSPTLQEQWLAVFKRLKLKHGFLLKAGLGIVIIGFISVFLAPYTDWAFLEITQYVLLFNFVLVGAVVYLQKPQWFELSLLTVLGLTAGLYLINVVISYSYSFFIPDFPVWPSTNFIRIWFEGIGFRYPEPFLNFVHVRYLNHIHTWTLPLVTLLVLRIPNRYWAFQKIAFIVACGWWMLVFAADARGTMLASFIALGFVFIMYRKQAAQWLRTHSFSAVIGLGLYLCFFELLQSGNGRTILTRYSDSGRFEMWNYALNLILQNPFLGVGPMHYAQFNTEVSFAAPHNVYLQFFSEWGIIAGVLALAIISLASYRWFISTNKVVEASIPNSKKVNTRIALTASLLAALIHGFFSGIINTPASQIMMVLVLAWMIGISISGKVEKQAEPITFWQRYSLIGVSLLAAGFLVWNYATHIPKLDQSRQQYLIKTRGNKIFPRYWDQGIIGLEVKEVGAEHTADVERTPKSPKGDLSLP